MFFAFCGIVIKITKISASIQSSSGGSSPENNNYLRVSAAFGQRRLSDNVLTTPGHRRLSGILGSTVSSPGSVPGTPLGVGFPIRRHSSAAFAANRRYSSNALLSPSSGSQVGHHKFFDIQHKFSIKTRIFLNVIWTKHGPIRSYCECFIYYQIMKNNTFPTQCLWCAKVLFGKNDATHIITRLAVFI